MARYRDECSAELAERIPGCQSVFYGHIGDGNMHLLAWVPGAAEQPEDAVDEVVYGLVREPPRHRLGRARHRHAARSAGSAMRARPSRSR